ncbi:NUDIX hydrolase [Sulfobacillus thermosulfidooxidans]|nr:NUDIX hydrolase [Sulfobacillus thermosulfidooxidans]
MSVPVRNNGEPNEPFILVSRRSFVVICAYNHLGQLLFVNQHRFAANRSSLELPQGELEDGESPTTAAIRELVEETGVLVPASAVLDANVQIYEAADWCQASGHLCFVNIANHCGRLYQPEFNVEWLNPLEFDAFIDKGRVIDATTIAAVHIFMSKRNGLDSA